MRWAYKCQMATCDPSFLLNKNSRKPHENYATDFHGVVPTDLPFSYPGALEEFYQGHIKHQADKENDARAAGNLFDFARITSDGQAQGLSFGSLGLATHISHIKSGYYASDTIKGVAPIVEWLSETSVDGCNLFRLLRDACLEYETSQKDFSVTPAGLLRNVTGLQYWRDIHGHTIRDANRSYTMHACNLDVFEEMLTRSYTPPVAHLHNARMTHGISVGSSCGQHFGNGKNWDSFGWYIQVQTLPKTDPVTLKLLSAASSCEEVSRIWSWHYAQMIGVLI